MVKNKLQAVLREAMERYFSLRAKREELEAQIGFTSLLEQKALEEAVDFGEYLKSTGLYTEEEYQELFKMEEVIPIK